MEKIATEILRRKFSIDATQFQIEEVEIYHEDDPYTHGHPSQLQVPSDRWYFHRASKKTDAKYKGGSFKGVDITFPGGGCLVRSISILPGKKYPKGIFIEGPCRVVEWLLEEAGCSDIEDFDIKNGLKVKGKLVTYEKGDGVYDDYIVSGPRVGLGYFPDDLEKYKTVFAPLRFCSKEMLKHITKYKSLMNMCPSNSEKGLGVLDSWKSAFDKDYDEETKPKSVAQWLSAYGTWLRYRKEELKRKDLF